MLAEIGWAWELDSCKRVAFRGAAGIREVGMVCGRVSLLPHPRQLLFSGLGKRHNWPSPGSLVVESPFSQLLDFSPGDLASLGFRLFMCKMVWPDNTSTVGSLGG